MGVGIVSRRMGVMDGKISNHAFGNKLLLTKLTDKDSVLVGWYLSCLLYTSLKAAVITSTSRPLKKTR